MKKYNLLACTALLLSTVFINSALAQNTDFTNGPRSAKQRAAANHERRNHSFSDFGQEYTNFKNWLSTEHGFDYSMDVSYLAQYGSPSGKKAGYQTVYSPSFTWKNFDNEYGAGTLNVAYTVVRYGGSSAETIGNNIGVVSGINDFSDPQNSFNELYYTYQLAGDMKWLSVSAGQFPIYNFDGSAYNSNQQVNFLNDALAQNASSSYPTSSLGGFATITPNETWSFSLGAQDATNTNGYSIRTRGLDEDKYTTFASATYSPVVANLGSGEYSILLYNQPNVEEKPQNTNGWSLNMSQDLNEKISVFARVNGVSGSQEEIDQSWMLGMAYNDPFDRNPLDQFGFAGAYNKIDEKAVGEKLSNDTEKVLETY